MKESLKQFKEDLQTGNVKNLFEAHERKEKISVDFPEIVKFGDQTFEEEQKYNDIKSFTKAFPPGSLVFVTTLNQDGIIQGTPNSKGEIPVLSGSMRLFVYWEKLKPPKKTLNPLKKKSSNPDVQVTFDARNDELDLRGQTVNDAIEKLEMSLDKAQMNKVERLKIIHGHGSDTLKKAVRGHLSRSVYVSRCQVSPAQDGGDGATLAYLMGD